MKRRKKGYNYIKFGEYSSSSSSREILKGQWGLSVSKGIGSGRGYGGMGGGLFGGIHHTGYGRDIGYEVYGEPVVVPYQPVNIDWKREKIDLSDTYKLLGKMGEPVDISKLFKIEGIDKSHLLPEDQKAFDIINHRLMSKYLDEIKALSPNLTQSDLMRDDVNYKINKLSMEYKNAVVHLFNELKANKERVDKNKETIDKLSGSWEHIDILSQEAKRHMNVINHSSFIDYKMKYGDRWADVAIDDLLESGTFSSLFRLRDIYQVQGPSISKNIQEYFVDSLTNDKISKIQALNPYAFEKTDKEQLSLDKIEELATISLGGIMSDNSNNTEIGVTAARILRNVNSRNKYLSIFEGANVDNLGDMARGIKGVVEDDSFKEKVSSLKEKVNKGGKLSSEDMIELRAITEALNAYMLTNKKREVRLLNKKIYIDKEKYENLSKSGIDVEVGSEGGRYYYIKREAYAVFNGEDTTKQVYGIRERGNASSPVINIDKDEYESLKDKEKYEILTEATVPKTIEDVDIDKIYEFMDGIEDIGDLSNYNVGANIAKFDIYSRMVKQGAAKLNIKQDIDIRLRDAVNVSVSQHNNAGGGELKEGELPEWATLTSKLRDNVKFGNSESFTQFLRSFVLGGNDNLEIANLSDISTNNHVFGIVNQSIVNSTIGQDFRDSNKVRQYPFYDMETGKVIQFDKLSNKEIEEAKKDFGYAFKDRNGNLVVGKLHEDLFSGKRGKFSSKLVTDIMSSTKLDDGHRHLRDAIVWSVSNPDYLRDLFGVDIEKAKREAKGRNKSLELVVAEEIGKTLDGKSIEERRSAMGKLLFAYLGKTANDIVVGAFMTVNGKRCFVQHTSATTAVSAMLPQDELARNASFLDRYKFMRPFLTMNYSLNYSDNKKRVEQEISSMNKDKIKELIDNLEGEPINSEVVNNIIQKIKENNQISEDEKTTLKRYLAMKLMVTVLRNRVRNLTESDDERVKLLEEKLRGVNQKTLETYLERSEKN